ncbi:hypothetical protein E2562_018233 [Oryza meyeriana var. granulata]|uniref:Uncharacterized protein n=1 Tax=Oryza meyeriana var. granulata TaxID=110450 RepID=A0A6G1CGM4_9ORYZ|nr:hypothetical protein E2562_018233 [Oryza meyeriana var. granulata]
MCRSLHHSRVVANDATADHPLVSSLKALRCLVFSPATVTTSPLSALPATVLRPFLDAGVRAPAAPALGV